MESDRALGNPQAYSAGFSRGETPLRLGRIDVPAFPGIVRLALLRHGLLTIALQFFGGAKTIVSFSFFDKPLSIVAINIHLVRLAIWRVRPSNVRPFVPVNAQPLQVFN